MAKFVIGIDYGTLSARAVLADVKDGRELASAEYVYPHGIMTERDFGSADALPTTALAHPEDYLEALGATIRGVLRSAGVMAEDVVAVCIDATASTMLPYLNDGAALSSLPEFCNNPHAYIKLWKHHGAEAEAEKMTRVATSRGEKWLENYGGEISAEWILPKMLEIIHRAPEVYAAADRFGEVADWLTERLTGSPCRSASLAGYKALYVGGYPSAEYLSAVDGELSSAIDKLGGSPIPLGGIAGYVSEEGARLSGLCRGTIVASPAIDAHAALPAARAVNSGDLTLIIGTSACHILISEEDIPFRGICGKVLGGVIDGYYAYETGQPCVGDMLAWFVEGCLPGSYHEAARERGVDIFTHLNSLLEAVRPGDTGLVVLDWWNGNRTPYVDYNLSGTIVGMTMATRPEDIYLAMLESIAYGTRRMIEIYREGGASVRRVIAAGGIPQKNPLLMQILADVLGESIYVTSSRQAGAKGCTIYAATAAGIYPDIASASAAMGDECLAVYSPRVGAYDKYNRLYEIYKELSCGFAAVDIMKRLREI